MNNVIKDLESALDRITQSINHKEQQLDNIDKEREHLETQLEKERERYEDYKKVIDWLRLHEEGERLLGEDEEVIKVSPDYE